MTHTRLKKITLLSLLMAAGTVSFAQMKVGGAPGAANSNAYLELGDATGATKGLLMPRVQLTATNATAPLTAHVAGMMVYNTATASSGATQVTPGYYVNDGTKWISLTNTAGTNSWNNVATQAAATGNTQNVYQMGAVGIGTNTPDTMKYKLDVAAKDARVNAVRIGLGGGNVSTNTVVGKDALTANTSGGGNLAVGMQALNANTTGQANTALGPQALMSNTTSSYNTAVGLMALHANTAVGAQALYMSMGNNNTALGYNSFKNLGSGDENIAVGAGAFSGLVNGSDNIAIGYAAAPSLIGGSNNIFIGANTNVTARGNYSNTLNIGNLIFGSGLGQLQNNQYPVGAVGVGVITPSERLDVGGAVKVGTKYAVTTNGQTTPVPAGGEGTIVYSSGHFFGWTGSSWKQLDN